MAPAKVLRWISGDAPATCWRMANVLPVIEDQKYDGFDYVDEGLESLQCVGYFF
jgi:hypothetical protein